MTHFIDEETGKLTEVIPGATIASNWVCLPDDFQAQPLESITTTKWDTLIFVSHPELVPALFEFGRWSKAEHFKPGTQVLLKNGRLSFHEPRPTPTEQRDAFQKTYPHLVDVDPGNFKLVAQLDTSPEHYRQGKIEPWDFITSQGMSFLEGNIVKYVTRYKAKDGLDDLLKAKTYLEKLISEVSKCESSKN